jgi:subtilase family serine protease
MVTAAIGATGAQAAAGRTAKPGGLPSWTSSAADLGAAAGAKQVSVKVYLAPNGGLAALAAAVKAVSTPGSPSFRHFITPAQYRAQFAPTAATVSAVSSWLAGAGFRVTGVEPSSRYVAASGSAAAVRAAFGTTLERFRTGGVVQTAPAGAVTVPDALAGAIVSVGGLDSKPAIIKPASHYPAGFRNARPCSAFFGELVAQFQADGTTPLPMFNGSFESYAPCGYTPSQFRTAYEGTPTQTGTGVTVAITDAYASPSIEKDANRYAANRGDAPFAPGQLTQTVATHFGHVHQCGGPAGWAGEESLEVEAVHGMAPGANVHYYGAASCYDDKLLDTLIQVVDDNQASIVTNSWGEAEFESSPALDAAQDIVFQQGALQGIGFFFSSGDDGDFGPATGTIQAPMPAASPYVTAVGGTSTGIDANGHLSFQTGWGTVKYSLSADGQSWVNPTYLYGAGGGFSHLYDRPAYQNGVVPVGTPGRAAPDVALDADPNTGMLVGETQIFPEGRRYDEYRIGGTSLASPLMAGVQAVAEQAAGARLGFANPSIYAQAGSASFTDVLADHTGDGVVRVDYANGVDASGGLLYSVRTFNQDTSLITGPGWDDVTGVGSPAPAYITSQGS